MLGGRERRAVYRVPGAAFEQRRTPGNGHGSLRPDTLPLGVEKFHKGLSDVYFQKINEEIYGTEPAPENAHKPVDVPVEQKPETKFGWIAPDGRFFGCGYGGHTSEARRIVGEIRDIRDPERHLENLGWAKVFKGMEERSRYSVGMGEGKKLTDAQLKELQRMGLDNANGLSLWL